MYESIHYVVHVSEYNNGMHAVVQYVLFRASSRKREFTPRCAYINTQGVNHL